MAVLMTHNLIWVKPHAGKVAGQPLSFKEKTQMARMRRMAFKGMIGKAEDHPELVKAYEESKSKIEDKVEKEAVPDPAIKPVDISPEPEEAIEDLEPEIIEDPELYDAIEAAEEATVEAEPEPEEVIEEAPKEEKSFKKGKKSKKKG